VAEATVCAGCGEEIDLFKNYLSATVKVQRNEMQTFTPAQLALAAGEELTFEMLDADEDESSETVVGTKSGPAAVGNFHSVECLISYVEGDDFAESGHADLKLRKNREDDSHLYAAAMAEGSDEGDDE
jgi:hypothetical protein